MSKTILTISIDKEIKDIAMIRWKGKISTMVEDYLRGQLQLVGEDQEEIDKEYIEKINKKYQEARKIKRELELKKEEERKKAYGNAKILKEEEWNSLEGDF